MTDTDVRPSATVGPTKWSWTWAGAPVGLDSGSGLADESMTWPFAGEPFRHDRSATRPTETETRGASQKGANAPSGIRHGSGTAHSVPPRLKVGGHGAIASTNRLSLH